MDDHLKKWTQVSVNYVNKTAIAPQRCSVCKRFIPGDPPACKGIESPISDDGWCKWFWRDSEAEKLRKDRIARASRDLGIPYDNSMLLEEAWFPTKLSNPTKLQMHVWIDDHWQETSYYRIDASI